MLTLSGVTKTFDTTRALRGLDLQIADARTTVLIGPSGSGKSTILRLMTGLVRPDAGEVLFDNLPMTPANIESLRRRIGYVIQEGGLFPHLTANANATLVARHLTWPREKIDQRVHELCELVRLPCEVLSRYPTELSGGQRQRVSLMRALMLDPAVLLLDEPLGALDPMIRFDLQNDLKEIFARLKKTVVMVTHDLAEAIHFGDWIVLLREGAIAQQGTVDDLLNRPADEFVKKFVQAQRGLA
ncbi:MAG TPA: ATP-binding cassette domain-containing protein [Tepidisphaeraceae bacterium]|jgi:osmoprotectant transport system ATP-binding protein|nr:ATP-binding cassette domain-containing protein [Tepidisphaeraceae bacterium]